MSAAGHPPTAPPGPSPAPSSSGGRAFDLRIVEGPGDGTTVVSLRGELDVGAVAFLHQRMVEVRRSSVRSVELDAAELSFADVRGVRALVAEADALRRARRDVRTRNLRPDVHRTVRRLLAEDKLGVE